MKSKSIFVILFTCIISGEVLSQSLTLNKMLDIATEFPKVQMKQIKNDLINNYGYKQCVFGTSGTESNFKLCKDYPNGEINEQFEFQSGQSKGDITTQIYYTVEAKTTKTDNLIANLNLLGFKKTYSDKYNQKFVGNYNSLEIIVRIDFNGEFNQIFILQNPNY